MSTRSPFPERRGVPPNTRVQRARSSPSAFRLPLTDRASSIVTIGSSAWACAAAWFAILATFGACQKASSTVIFKSDERFSKSDSRPSDLSPPRALSRVEPLVPERCRKAGVEGRFVFDVTVTERGTVEDLHLLEPTVVTPPCPNLEAAVREALSRSKYEPTMIDGRPARVVLTITQRIDAR